MVSSPNDLDNYGWPYIFYMNAVPGVLMIAAVWFTMEKQPMDLGLLKKGDWWGILTMAIGLAAFEIVLEDGNRKDWFGDPGIVKLAWTAAIFIPAFIIIELRKKDPLVDLRLFARRNFGLGSIVNVVLGIGLYAVVFILPLTWDRCMVTMRPRLEWSSSGWVFHNFLSSLWSRS